MTATPIKLKPNRTVTGLPGITHWTIRHDRRGELLVLSNGNKAVHFLGRDPNGNWVNHGENAFLVPAPPSGISLPLTKHDAVVAHSVLRLNEYHYPPQFPPGAVVLDLGAHCGLSVKAALDRGAAHVVAAEPAPGNLEYLRRNFGDDSRVTILPVAAWTRSGTVRLSPGVVPSKPTDSSAGWNVSEGGVLEVPCLAFEDLVQAAVAKSESGRVAMLKLDIEGAEWSILLGANLSCVDAISIEYHGAHRDDADTPERLAAMLGPEFACAIHRHPEAKRLGILTAVRTAA